MKTVTIGIKVTEEEKAAIISAALKDNRTLSAWSRIMLVKAAKEAK
jgi:hypothetical protein